MLWCLWKNRNKFFFEGREFDGEGLIVKIQQEAEIWFLAQTLDQNEDRQKEVEVEVEEGRIGQKWRKPPDGWLKCNVGWFLVKKTRFLGCAWVVRDSNGVAIWHSRRSFVEIQNLNEAKMQTLSWALESMVAHRVEKLIMGIEDPMLCGSLERPNAWPSFKVESSILLNILTKIPNWKCCLEVKDTNKGAFLIAKSATTLPFVQSYEAAGRPGWLATLFDSERVRSFV